MNKDTDQISIAVTL